MKNKFIQIKEASEILGVSKLTLRNWDLKGKLTAYRHPINNYRVYKLEDIENIIKGIESRKSTPNKKLSTVINKDNASKSKTYTIKVVHLED